MDQHGLAQPLAPSHASDCLAVRVLAGADVVVLVEGDRGRALLDETAGRLAERRIRVLRAAATSPSSFSLSVLMAQVTGQSDLAAHDDEILERGFRALTALDPTCDRVVLLVSEAHLLQRAALRYIQFACGSTSHLTLVLAGSVSLTALLDAAEFGVLRARLGDEPMMLPANDPQPTVMGPATVRSGTRRRRAAAWTGVGVGMVACLVLGIWIGQHGLPSDGPEPFARLEQTPPSAETRPALASGTKVPDTVATAASSEPLDADTSSLVAPTAQSRSTSDAESLSVLGTASVVTSVPQARGFEDSASEPAASMAGGEQPIEHAPPPGSIPVAPTMALRTPAPPDTMDVVPEAPRSPVEVAIVPALPLAPSIEASAEPGPTAGTDPPAAAQTGSVVVSSRTTKPPRGSSERSQGAGRRSASTQPRVAAAVRSSGAPPWSRNDEFYPSPPPDWRPWPRQAVSGGWQQATDGPYIGTYTTGVDGVRMFRFGP